MVKTDAAILAFSQASILNLALAPRGKALSFPSRRHLSLVKRRQALLMVVALQPASFHPSATFPPASLLPGSFASSSSFGAGVFNKVFRSSWSKEAAAAAGEDRRRRSEAASRRREMRCYRKAVAANVFVLGGQRPKVDEEEKEDEEKTRFHDIYT